MRDAIVTPEEVVEGLGAFDELEYLGGGTFGDTYRAVRGEDEVALKVIHADGLPTYLWDREVEALRRVDHPNVVGFIDSGSFESTAGTRNFLRCEYIDGGDLMHVIGSGRKPEASEEVIGLITGLLAGLAEIHDLGILHRDVKPANIALRDGDFGMPVLLDFGLARVHDMTSHTRLPAQIGTTRYMAPEQLKGGAARRRSDLFAAAVVVYEVLTGQHPFLSAETSTSQDLHDQIKKGAVSPPSDFCAVCPAPVDLVLTRLLSYRAHERLGVSAAMRDLKDGA